MIRDLIYTEDCDFYLDQNRNISKTNDDVNLSRLKQTIIKRLQTTYSDYVVPSRDNILNADLLDYLGKNINQELLSTLKYNIYNVLTYDGLIDSTNLKFLNQEILETEVYLLISIEQSKNLPIYLNIVYDTKNNHVTPRILRRLGR
jgi:hypothetical protein